ncbi:MAG TPA: putative baseplate assembly protein [Terracidiphilus sp.]|nr:putative baseplate assembly protein [Terracidiphilus sp.]
MNDSTLSCLREKRREDVRTANLFGLDYVDVVDPQQLTLNVFFLGKAPQNFEKANLVLTGGRRIRDVQIKNVRVRRQADPTLDDYLEIRVNKAGDFSTYTISAVNAVNGEPTNVPMDGFDLRYSQVCFSFKASCPTDFDCKQPCTCAPPQGTQPEIDYLAKDYESFRQLILDRMAINMPQWSETHEPDIGIMLAELLAYTGDYLSYYQDAVATEAYLNTARQRISVRRHARLVDYAMHDGCNARAWLTISTDLDQQLDPAQIYFITRYPGAPVNRHILSSSDLTGVDTTTFEVFEPLYWNGGTPISLYAAHSEIHFYTWGDCQCCLAPGATSATLTDAWVTPPNPSVRATDSPSATSAESQSPGSPRQLQLQIGDILIFEEVLGPKTGQAPDADPTHRQAVRLTSVTPGVDPLYDIPIVEIEWASEDALAFPLCISSQEPAPDCGCMQNVSVARGNVILVDHGGDPVDILGNVPTLSSSAQCPKCCEAQSVTVTAGLFRPALTQQPLTASAPLPPACSAHDFLQQDPRQALPQIAVTNIPPAPECPPADPSQPQPPCVMQALFTFDDLADPSGLAKSLRAPTDPNTQFLLSLLSSATRQALTAWDGALPLPPALSAALIADMTTLVETWSAKRDLLESGPGDRDFVVETDNDGYGHLRFGDGVRGAQPQAGALFRASYRVGNGTAGNVGAETIAYIVFRQEKLSGVNLQPRNPMAATGGVDPEPIDDVKHYAPYAFRGQLERAITAADYASLAADNDRRLEERATLEAEDDAICTASFTRLQSAKADLRWTGSWYTALVALDPAGSETASRELIEEVSLYLEPFRRMGCDLLVSPAEYVPLKVAITVCVLPNYLRGDVEKAVADALSNRVLPGGALGFFHPDNLTFGSGVYVSRLLAAVQAVTGVQSAIVTDLERLEIIGTLPIASQPVAGLPPDWVLQLGPFEIAQLDNDPNYPEHGLLVLDVRGGR